MVRAVRKLQNQPLPLFIALALTTAALVFAAGDLFAGRRDSAEGLIAATRSVPAVGGASTVSTRRLH